MDAAGRTLERKVEADSNDHDSRFALTLQKVRSKTGIVAFWYGRKKPHQSAVKVAIGFDVVNPLRPEHVISHPETIGWVLAVSSLEDLFEASTAQCGSRLLDLSNWRSIGVYGEAAAFLPKGEIKPQAGTVDAFGRPRDVRTGDERSARVPATVPWEHIDEANDTAWDRRPFNSPRFGSSLWDREVHRRDGTIASFPFFRNTRSFVDATAGSKNWGLDTNLLGQGSGLPVGHSMAVTGISLFLDGYTGPFSPELRRELVDVVGSTAYLDFRVGAAQGLIIPASLALPREDVNLEPVTEDDAVRLTGVAPAVYPLGQAIPLEPLLDFGVDLRFPNRSQLDNVVRSHSCNGVVFKVVLHGPMFAPLQG